ncbi:hypothetical protein LWI29_027318 [Acer saccharum]|uniref:Uncharacterized protein n=1 Tax=Acer saccharum TaxID=4024 RepID=A0AA39VK37_ACESA|nr:hypothetical protein LWI29_027318 [Acer saccharum]
MDRDTRQGTRFNRANKGGGVGQAGPHNVTDDDHVGKEVEKWAVVGSNDCGKISYKGIDCEFDYIINDMHNDGCESSSKMIFSSLPIFIFFLPSYHLSLSPIAAVLTIDLLRHSQLAVNLPSLLAVELISLAARRQSGLSRRSPSICLTCCRSPPIWTSLVSGGTHNPNPNPILITCPSFSTSSSFLPPKTRTHLPSIFSLLGLFEFPAMYVWATQCVD